VRPSTIPKRKGKAPGNRDRGVRSGEIKNTLKKGINVLTYFVQKGKRKVGDDTIRLPGILRNQREVKPLRKEKKEEENIIYLQNIEGGKKRGFLKSLGSDRGKGRRPIFYYNARGEEGKRGEGFKRAAPYLEKIGKSPFPLAGGGDILLISTGKWWGKNLTSINFSTEEGGGGGKKPFIYREFAFEGGVGSWPTEEARQVRAEVGRVCKKGKGPIVRSPR